MAAATILLRRSVASVSVGGSQLYCRYAVRRNDITNYIPTLSCFLRQFSSSANSFVESPVQQQQQPSPIINEAFVRDIMSDEKLLKVFMSQLQLVLDHKNKDNNNDSQLPNAKVEDDSLCKSTSGKESITEDEASEDEKDESDKYSEDEDDSFSDESSQDESSDDNEPHDNKSLEGDSSDKSKDESSNDNKSPAQNNNKSLEGDSFESLPVNKMENPLTREIDQEISKAEELSKCYNAKIIVPEGFPFRVYDNAGTKSIFLSREGEGERVEVTVDCPITYNDSHAFDRLNKDIAFSMDLTVLFICTKTNVSRFEFKCTARSNRVAINEVTVPAVVTDNKGFRITDLDEMLRNEFHKYLEARGITPGNTNFLYDYMLDKTNKEKLRLLKKIKEMVV